MIILLLLHLIGCLYNYVVISLNASISDLNSEYREGRLFRNIEYVYETAP